jgi:hypothetical protein
MTAELLAAILNFATRFGIDAVVAFLTSRGSTIEDAIVALGHAKEKSLAEYIAEDAAKRRLVQELNRTG